MHEIALCRSMLRIVEEHAQRHGAGRVKTVRIEVGALTCVDPEALRFGFSAISRGTAAEGSSLDFTIVPASGWCVACGREQAMHTYIAECPACGDPLEYRGGGDILRVKGLGVDPCA